MEFDTLMKALAAHLGGVALEPDADGVVTLAVDDMRVRITDRTADGEIVLAGDVGPAPADDRLGRLYRALLEANHLFSGTGGAFFAEDAQTHEITLVRTLVSDALDGETFCQALTNFVNTLESWVRLLSEYCRTQPSEETPPSAMPDFGMRV